MHLIQSIQANKTSLRKGMNFHKKENILWLQFANSNQASLSFPWTSTWSTKVELKDSIYSIIGCWWSTAKLKCGLQDPVNSCYNSEFILLHWSATNLWKFPLWPSWEIRGVLLNSFNNLQGNWIAKDTSHMDGEDYDALINYHSQWLILRVHCLPFWVVSFI